ncbi:MAG: glycosyltransferase [Opitutaceae bacterium]|nr:glycosyltransferase [Opitutaceae bacterium]MBP9911797.1 glycosyltransferase [Opitutaceae bacterium]
MKSVFIHDPADLQAAIPGGVQLCSQDFLQIVQAASMETRLLAVNVTRAPSWRLRRQFGLGAYLFYRPSEARAAFMALAAGFNPTHLFLNRAELIRLAPLAAKIFPDAQIVVMSHGNQSGDDLYEVAGPGGRRASGLSNLGATWRIGLNLAFESHYRHRYLHGVCAMSEEEAVLERWLGARRVLVLPRVFACNPLPCVPVPGRLGYVGTLDHTPNRLALEAVCEELQRQKVNGLELHLAGGPAHIAEALAFRFPFVRPLGRIDDATLQKEAATWSLFINPIFWLSRGASMKLALALGWGLPVITSRSGARGYEWHDGSPSLTEDNAEAFVRQTIGLLNSSTQLAELRAACARAANSSPRIPELAQRLQTTFPVRQR